MRRQNDEMYSNLNFSKHQFNSPSYKLYLENQEKRHSEQISSIYAQNQQHISQLNEKIAKLHFDRNENDRKQLVKVKDLEQKLSHVEIKYKQDIQHLRDELEYEKSRTSECNHENKYLKAQLDEQEKQYYENRDEYNKCKHSHAEVEISLQQKISDQQYQIAELESQLKFKTEETKSLHIRISESEKSYLIKIDNLKKAELEMENRFNLRTQEFIDLQNKMK